MKNVFKRPIWFYRLTLGTIQRSITENMARLWQVNILF